MAENFLEVITDTNLQIQEAQTTSRQLNTKDYACRHIVFKLQKPQAKGKSKRDKTASL